MAPVSTPSSTAAPAVNPTVPVASTIGAQPTPAAQPAPTMPGVPVDGSPTIQTRLPTMGGEQSIALPMSGPSKRTMIIAGGGIAIAGIALGALVAMRAIKNNAPAPAPQSDQNVALVETPHVIGQADGGADAGSGDESHGGHASGSSTGRPRTSGSGAGGTASSGAHASAGTTSGSSGSSSSSGSGSTRPSSGGSTSTGSSGSSGNAGGGGTVAAGEPTGSGSGTAPTPGDLAQLNGGGSTTGGGIAPRGPSVGGYVQGEETDATGTMDPTVFSYVYRHYRPQVAACQSMVTRNASITGTLRIRIRLGVDGHVVRTRVLSNTTNNADLATCVQNSIRTWAYPRPEGGEVEFDYNFGFGS